MTQANRMAFLSLGDVFLSTPVRLGLYLVAYEYVLCSQKKQGVVVLSEFIGCAKILNEVLRVNPWNIEETALVISRALSMEPAHRARAHRQNLAFVQKSTLFKWADSFLQDAIRAGVAGHTKGNDVIYSGLANGTVFNRLVGSSQHLKADSLQEAYLDARKRVLVFNYEALEDQKDSKELYQIFGELSRDPRNSVFIMTDNSPDKLDLWRRKLGKEYDPKRLIGVSAEQGCYYQWHGSSAWECISKDLDLSWKRDRSSRRLCPTAGFLSLANCPCVSFCSAGVRLGRTSLRLPHALRIMEAYAARTDGSAIKEHWSSLFWDYEGLNSSTARELGLLQAKTLQQHLEDELREKPVQVICGEGYVLVKPSGTNNGYMVQRWLELVKRNKGAPDFIFGCGDAVADNVIFSSLAHHEFDAEQPKMYAAKMKYMHAYTT